MRSISLLRLLKVGVYNLKLRVNKFHQFYPEGLTFLICFENIELPGTGIL